MQRKGNAMGGDEKRESQRGRVRRLLLEPLQDLGFRFKKGTPDDKAARRLTSLCDDLSYLSDESLQRLKLAMRDKGEGSARCFWPERATFIAFAQMVQERRIEDMPGMVSWFASAAGAAAVAGDRLVAEYRWWNSKHRPPMNEREKWLIDQKAKEFRSREEGIRDRMRRNVPVDMDDQGWLRAYEADHALALSLVQKARGAA